MTRWRKTLRWIAAAGAALGVAFVAWSAYFTWELTRATHRPVGAVPADFPYPVEAVRFAAEDGLSIAGWFVPCPEATRVAVLLHGARRNRLENVARARLLRQQGYAVLLYDARGCGESAGDVLTFGFHETKDLLGALDYLRGRGFRQFGLVGFSQGGITIVNAADRLRDLCWVVLECTPADMRQIFDNDMRNAYGGVGRFAGILIRPMVLWHLGISGRSYIPQIDNVANLHCPVYFIASDADKRVLPDEARALFARANEPKWLWMIPGVPHANYYPLMGRLYEEHVLYFLKLADRELAERARGPAGPKP